MSSTGEFIQTVLGSCVAVCLYDHVKQIGGMNHFLLAKFKDASRFKAIEVIGKYGNLAIPELVRRIENRDGNRCNIVAKIVGGASILAISSQNNVPESNVQGAREILTKLSIPVVAQDTGGKQGRKVLFNTKTGRITINEKKIL